MASVNYIFRDKYNSHKTTLKDTSYDKDNRVYLCNDERQEVYDFDDIVKKLYPAKQPASYDALIIYNNDIYCIEFKNQKYSNIDNSSIKNKLKNSKEVMDKIFKENNINIKNYKFIYCVAYKNDQSKWRRGITKDVIQFGLEEYKGKYYDEIFTNDIDYFTNEYKKKFNKELKC